jgi:hypothetical protein
MSRCKRPDFVLRDLEQAVFQFGPIDNGLRRFLKRMIRDPLIASREALGAKSSPVTKRKITLDCCRETLAFLAQALIRNIERRKWPVMNEAPRERITNHCMICRYLRVDFAECSPVTFLPIAQLVSGLKVTKELTHKLFELGFTGENRK